MAYRTFDYRKGFQDAGLKADARFKRLDQG